MMKTTAYILVLVSGFPAAIHAENPEARAAIVGSGPAVLVTTPHRIRFVRIPADVKLGKDARGRNVFLRDAVQVDPETLAATREMTFKYPVSVFPAENSKHFLVCVNPLLPVTSTGSIADFCGITSAAGATLFRFPAQRRPDRLYSPIGISADGEYAEVAVAEEIEGEDHPDLGSPKEVLAWAFPNTLKRYPGPSQPAGSWDQVRKTFRERTRAK